MGTGTVLHAVVKAPGRFERLVLTAPPTTWEARAAQAEIYERRLVPQKPLPLLSHRYSFILRFFRLLNEGGAYSELARPKNYIQKTGEKHR